MPILHTAQRNRAPGGYIDGDTHRASLLCQRDKFWRVVLSTQYHVDETSNNATFSVSAAHCPLKLDPMTAVDDTHFLTDLNAQINLPQAIKDRVKLPHTK